MNLEALGDRVIIRVDVPEEQSVGGIIIPQMAQETPMQGTVLSIGDGELASGSRLGVGDRVIYARHGGQFVEADDGEVLVLGIRDVIARITQQDITQQEWSAPVLVPAGYEVIE